MGRPKLNIVGLTFGRLSVKALSHVSERGYAMFSCVCVCGGEKILRGSALTSETKPVKSCGCLIIEGLVARSTKHGEAANGKPTPEWRAWNAMRARCGNPDHPAYKWYGARGIKVCDRWQSVESFIADMGRRPSAQHSLDRVDNDGNYEPSNCRWATNTQQTRNSRGKLPERTVREIKDRLSRGEAHQHVADIFGVNRSTVSKISRGERWSDVQ